VSWTAGANYKITPEMDVYARASEGAHFPSFDDVRSAIVDNGAGKQIADASPLPDLTWTVRSYELGWKFHNHTFDIGLTGFYDLVHGAVYNDVDTPTVIAGSRAYGLEFDGAWTSDFGLSITTNDTIQNATTDDPIDANFNGKQAERIPKYQARITPAYRFDVASAKVNIYGTFMAIGQRWSDLGNTEDLPAYQTVNAGVIVDLPRNLSLQISGDNLTNSHGLTEGDPRQTPGETSLANSRPIFGRSATFSLAWKF